MAKLHELLAADSTVREQGAKCRSDLMASFDKKRHLFEEKRTTFTPLAEGEPVAVEHQSDLNTTVRKELSWLTGILSKAIDLGYQINVANTIARADVVIDGAVVLLAVPATALLELEKRASEVHALIASIPTLDPAKGFTLDATRSDGVYVAREVTKTRTKKVQQALVLYPATPEHPAQTQLVPADVPTGTIREQEWSGLITPVEKADMLDRAEKLRAALKEARARANDVSVTQDKVGETVLSYVFGK